MIEYQSRFKVLWQFLNKNIRLLAARIKPYILNYDSYVCLLTQSGTSAPVPTVLSNGLRLSVSYTYDNVGVYTVILNKELFESPNEYVTITSASVTPGTSNANVVQAVPVFTSAIEIRSFKDGSPSNDMIGPGVGDGAPCIFEIRKYY